jgi:hypothetical protein
VKTSETRDRKDGGPPTTVIRNSIIWYKLFTIFLV